MTLVPGRHEVRPRRLVLLGSVLVDVLLDVPALPPRGGDVLGRPSYLGAGGGFTVLTAAARLGLPGAYAGAHGTGPMGDRVRADLAAAGITTLLPRTDAGDTGYTVGLVEPDGERTFATAPGVEAELTPAQLAAVRVGAADAVYLSGYDLAYPVSGPPLAAFVAALPDGPLVVLDPGPLVADIPAERWDAVTARADLVSANAREVSARPVSPRGALVVRHGRDGAHVVTGGRTVPVPGFPVDAIDTTGAGDVHVGAMLAALGGGEDLVAAVRTANRAAAWSVRHRGPATGPRGTDLAGWRGGE